MGSSNLKRSQQIAFLGVAAFLALGFTVVQRGVTELGKLGRGTLWMSGSQTKQTLSLHDFDRIQAGGLYQVDVSFGARSSVVIEAPKGLLPHLTAEVSGGTLILGIDSSFRSSRNVDIKAHVVTRRLLAATISGVGKMVINGKIKQSAFEAHAEGAATLKLSANVDTFSLEASGASKTTLDGFDAKSLRIESSGAANCSINGSADNTSISASGASSVAGKLTANRADVETSGSAHASLRVTSSLTGEASGASSITYSGRPGKVTTQTSGVGHIGRSD